MAPSKQPKHYSTLYLKECLWKLVAILVEFLREPPWGLALAYSSHL